MYKESIVPPGFPGGGGFSVMKFTLSNLYDMHQKCSNWWTNSNENLPLCRYLGCRIKCYASATFDYIIKYSTSLPAHSTKLTYPSTQPSMLMMSTNKKIVPSRKTNPRKKPYTILKIRPPSKLENKWYFQKEIRELPLLVLYAAPTSLTQFYINTQAENNNVTLYSINTQVVTNRNFKQPVWPIKVDGTKSIYLWEYTGQDFHTGMTDFQCKHLIPLTNIRHFTQGSSYAEAYPTSLQDKHADYCKNINMYTGNPFVKEHRQTEGVLLISETGPNTFADQWKNKELNIKSNQIMNNNTPMTLTILQQHLIETYRYNPFRDTGSTTQMYLLKCDEDTQALTAWNPPNNPDIILEGFPLWLNIWGYTDFQHKLGAYQNIETNCMLVFKSEALSPSTKKPIVLIDQDYLNNRSPFEETVNDTDKNRWYPQLQYQTQEMNKIALTGPGTPKLYTKTSDQIVIKYDFYFKWGGDPARMVNVENPLKQIVYPMPSDEHKTTSLQSPAQAIETVMYSFDQRRNEITKRALERITQDWDITNLLSSITETTGELPAIQTYPQETQKETTTEKEKEKILLQLIEQRNRQQQLRLGIINLMKQLDL